MKPETAFAFIAWLSLVALLAGFVLFLRITDAYDAKIKEAKEYCLSVDSKPKFCDRLFEQN